MMRLLGARTAGTFASIALGMCVFATGCGGADLAAPADTSAPSSSSTSAVNPSSSSSEVDGPVEYEVSAMVLESAGHGPQLCVGGIQTSYPPGCGGPDIVGWDWDETDDEASHGATTWGQYLVVGTWDGERLTLTRPPTAPRPQERDELDDWDFTSPCAAPAGGWIVDAARTSDADADAMKAYAEGQPDFGGLWVDHSINAEAPGEPRETVPPPPGGIVWNVRFTGDLDRHEATIRERWGGALCLGEVDHALADLERIRDELQAELDPVSGGVHVIENVVFFDVVHAPDGLQAELDERYGEGVVRVRSRLQPVS